MTFKQLIKLLLPPVVTKVYHNLRYGSQAPAGPIWEGVYKAVEEVPLKKEETQDHDGKGWAEMIARNTAAIQQRGQTYKTVPFDVKGEHALLPLLVAVLQKKQEKLKVLDWGGGAGVEYIHLMNSLGKNKQIAYTVVEWENVCREALGIYQGDERIRFLPEIPGTEKFDVVLVKSAMQYAKNYEEEITKLCACHAEYFFFIKLAAGDFPTYVTLQKNIPGMHMAYWFINISELTKIMKKNGYELVYKSVLEQEYEQENFPGEYRMGNACNLLFAKS